MNSVSEVRSEYDDDPGLRAAKAQRVFDRYGEETTQMAIETVYNRMKDKVTDKARLEWPLRRIER